jgi:hypothetical protein
MIIFTNPVAAGPAGWASAINSFAFPGNPSVVVERSQPLTTLVLELMELFRPDLFAFTRTFFRERDTRKDHQYPQEKKAK